MPIVYLRVLRLLPRPRLDRLEVLEIFSDLFLFVIGLHIHASTITPTITPITMPAIDPLPRPEFPVVEVVVDELVTVAAAIMSEQAIFQVFKAQREHSY